MKIKRILNVIVGMIVVILVSQCLNLVLGFSSFENTYRTSLISRYGIIGKEMKTLIETSVNFGKPIKKFSGMDDIFTKIRNHEKNIDNLYVSLPNGRILYSTDGTAVDQKINIDTMPVFTREQLNDSRTVLLKNDYLIMFPVFKNNTTWVANIYIQFKKKLITDKVKAMILYNLKYFFIILGAAVCILSIVLIIVNLRIGTDAKSKKRALRFSYLIIGFGLVSSQLVYSYNNNQYFEEMSIAIFKENVLTLSNVSRNNLEYFIDIGLPVDRLKKAEAFLNDRLKNVPECKEMIVTDIKGRVLYRSDRILMDSILEPMSYLSKTEEVIDLGTTESRIVIPIRMEYERVGYIIAKFNKELIDDTVFDLTLDALTVIAVAIIFSFQLLLLFSLIFSEKKATISDGKGDEVIFKVIRLTSFIFFFAELIPLSYIPIFIKKLYEANPIQIAGFSPDTMISLPISAYMLGLSFAMFLTGFVSRKLPVRNIFFIFGGMLVTGALGSAFSQNIVHLIIFRFISGMGYGGCMMNGSNLVVRTTNSSNRATGFGYWSAGYAAAIICAISIGGVIVARLGYRTGMMVSSAFAVLFIIFIALNIKKSVKEPELRDEEKFNIKEVFYIFKNRSLIANLLFSSIPFQLVYIGIYQYIFPLYMSNEGISQANIGRILTIFGLIYLFTPMISKIADKIRNDKLFIITGNFIIGIFLVFFAFSESFYMFITAILAIGLGTMIGDAVEESYITSSKEAKEIGEAKLLSIYVTFEKISAIIVPIVTGLLITTLSYTKSIIVIGFIILGCVTLFSILGRNMRKDTKV